MYNISSPLKRIKITTPPPEKKILKNIKNNKKKPPHLKFANNVSQISKEKKLIDCSLNVKHNIKEHNNILVYEPF